MPFSFPVIWAVTLLISFINALGTKVFLREFYLECSILELTINTWLLLGAMLTAVALINRVARLSDPFYFFVMALLTCAVVSGISAALITNFPWRFDYATNLEFGYWPGFTMTFTLHFGKGLVMVCAATGMLLACRHFRLTP